MVSELCRTLYDNNNNFVILKIPANLIIQTKAYRGNKAIHILPELQCSLGMTVISHKLPSTKANMILNLSPPRQRKFFVPVKAISYGALSQQLSSRQICYT
jgi:hypothetical protein